MRLKTFGVLVGLGAAAVTGVWALKPAPARCQACYSGVCYNNNICGNNGCFCLKQGTSPGGVCASLGR